MSPKSDDVRLAYLNQGILTASRENLLLMTYEIAINACRKAARAIDDGELESANMNLKTAQKSLRELRLALRPDKAEQLARSLDGLYDFMFHELVTANVTKDSKKVLPVISMLEDLYDGWKDAMEKLDGERTVSSGGDENTGRVVNSPGESLNISC